LRCIKHRTILLKEEISTQNSQHKPQQEMPYEATDLNRMLKGLLQNLVFMGQAQGGGSSYTLQCPHCGKEDGCQVRLPFPMVECSCGVQIGVLELLDGLDLPFRVKIPPPQMRQQPPVEDTRLTTRVMMGSLTPTMPMYRSRRKTHIRKVIR